MQHICRPSFRVSKATHTTPPPTKAAKLFERRVFPHTRGQEGQQTQQRGIVSSYIQHQRQQNNYPFLPSPFHKQTMSYPTWNFASKHNLFTVPLPHRDNALLDAIGIPDTRTFFQKQAEKPPDHAKILASVYSYKEDSPSKPLSSSMCIIGVLPETHPLLRSLIGDNGDQLHSSLHRCSLAVYRGDGGHAHELNESRKQSSFAFAKFIRQLRHERAAAVLKKDKYDRVCILKPVHPSSPKDDFHVMCYVGIIHDMEATLRQNPPPSLESSPSPLVPRSPPPPPGGFDDRGQPVWDTQAPPAISSHSTHPQPASSSNGNVPMWERTEVDIDDEPVFRPDDYDEYNHGTSSAAADKSSTAMEPVASASTNGSKVQLWQPPASNDSVGTALVPSRKRARANDDDNDKESKQFHANEGAAAADRFYSGLTRNQETRGNSRLLHMRNFNGWVKATQIQELNPRTGPNGTRSNRPLRVLDLACGKGGDLLKWANHHRGIENYVGIDVARGSLADAAVRARNMRGKLKACTFSCADLGHDVPGRLRSPNHKNMQKLSTWSLQKESGTESGRPVFTFERGGGISPQDRFDVVSIQFAIHYMMQTKKRARRFFRTVSQLLDVGGDLIATTTDARVLVGHLMNLGLNLHAEDDTSAALGGEPVIRIGGGACRISFPPEIVRRIFHSKMNDGVLDELFGLEYFFTLVEGTDHAAGVGDAVNLPEWLTPLPVLVELAKEVGLQLDYAQNFHEYYQERADPSKHTAAHSSLYNMNVLNKNGSISSDEWEISRIYMAIRFRKVREVELDPLSDDEKDPGDDDDEEEDDDEDNLDMAYMLPAMKAAKREAGDAWDSMTKRQQEELIRAKLKELSKKK